ncbi:MAG: hypothetical protein V3T02_08285 [Alphaproteobacteria bacterium]
MHKRLRHWCGQDFIALASEGRPGMDAAEETADIFRRMALELDRDGLTLNDTVRTRLWGRDRKSRDGGSKVRRATLDGPARSASSSYIKAGHFDSDANVAIELLAMRPPPGANKTVEEFEPPRTPLRYLTLGPMVVLSGFSAELPTLADQVADILARITPTLDHAGTSWQHACLVSCYLHESQTIEALQAEFAKSVTTAIPEREYGLVDGYSSEGKLIEIEVTARLPQ